MPHLPQADCDILDRAQRIANRVYRDFKDAQDSWTVLQNLQSRIDSNTDFSAALTRSVPGGLRQINNALFMNTVMGLMRMSDDPGSKDDRQSACSLTGILRNQIVLQAVCTDDWLTRHLSVPNDAVLRIERLEQPKRIARFLSIVPLGWNKGDRRPNPDKLGSVREILRGLRTEVYAHSLEANGTRVPRPSDIVATLDLSFEIASGAH